MAFDCAVTSKSFRIRRREKHLRGQGGFSSRNPFTQPFGWSTVLIHGTHGKIGNSFEAESNYLLQNSLGVGAHLLIGKLGQIDLILPFRYDAHHAGEVVIPKYGNEYSIGIELHIGARKLGVKPTAGLIAATNQFGVTWEYEMVTQPQADSLRRVLSALHQSYGVNVGEVASHRTAAPARKFDPGAWPEASLMEWVNGSLRPGFGLDSSDVQLFRTLNS